MIRNINEAKPGSAWDTWRKAGKEWREQTWATTPGALLVAANCYASEHVMGLGENWRDTIKLAFMEGAAQ
jgi:hypothetical protein